MIPYKTKSQEIPGTNLGETYRSAYFKKEKIFFDFFWNHLKQKSPKERFKRLKLFKSAIEVIKNSRNKPETKTNPNKKTEIFYRFAGLTKSQLFIVQIKENKRSKNKYLMSCFSIK